MSDLDWEEVEAVRLQAAGGRPLSDEEMLMCFSALQADQVRYQAINQRVRQKVRGETRSAPLWYCPPLP